MANLGLQGAGEWAAVAKASYPVTVFVAGVESVCNDASVAEMKALVPRTEVVRSIFRGLALACVGPSCSGRLLTPLPLPFPSEPRRRALSAVRCRCAVRRTIALPPQCRLPPVATRHCRAACP